MGIVLHQPVSFRLIGLIVQVFVASGPFRRFFLQSKLGLSQAGSVILISQAVHCWQVGHHLHVGLVEGVQLRAIVFFPGKLKAIG